MTGHLIKSDNQNLTIPLIGMSSLLIAFIISLAFLSHIGLKMIEQHSPLVDASMEIKTNVALHHLWLEELIQGDPTINEKEVWAYLDNSEWYAKAMLYGAENFEGTYIPLDDATLNEQIKSVIEQIQTLRNAARLRLNQPLSSQIGSKRDQAFDLAFNETIQQADDVESYLQAVIFNQIENYKNLSFSLLMIFIVISLLTLIGYIYFERQRRSDRNKHQQLLEQLNQAQKMEAIGTLVGGIAHNFNNTLAGMTGNLYLAKQQAKAIPNVVQRLTQIEQLSFRAADTIQQLLTFARKGQMNTKQMSLASSLKEMLNLVRTMTPENIDLDCDICNDSPLIINADASLLHQVLINLVNNACDALQGTDDPCIRIKLTHIDSGHILFEDRSDVKAARYAHLSVEDNGCGIPEDQFKHLFEPFFTTKEVGKGTGLGLSMVYGAIKTHHGHVDVKSIPGTGTTFHIYLPLLQESEIILSAPPQNEAISKGSGETILLVDDEREVLEVGKEVLESLGYQVLVAMDGLEAIEVFTTNQHKVSLILTDVIMPRLGGVEAIKRIREESPDIHVIFASGYDNEIITSSSTSTHSNIMISKPYSINEIAKLIREQLDSP